MKSSRLVALALALVGFLSLAEKKVVALPASGEIRTQAPSALSVPQKREIYLTMRYVNTVLDIQQRAEPSWENLSRYIDKADSGTTMPYSMWRPSMENIVGEAFDLKGLKSSAATTKTLRSYCVEYASNSIRYMNSLYMWVRNGDERYISVARGYLQAVNHYDKLIDKETTRLVLKFDR